MDTAVKALPPVNENDVEGSANERKSDLSAADRINAYVFVLDYV